MKLDFDSAPDALYIRFYEIGRIVIGETIVTAPVIVTNTAIRTDILPPRFGDLEKHHFLQMIELDPEIVVLGSGRSQRLLDPRLAYPLLEKGIGVESMDTGAACRCYNVLAAENRSVLAAIYMIES